MIKSLFSLTKSGKCGTIVKEKQRQGGERVKGIQYRRDLPGDTKQYFQDKIERPDAGEPYFDDLLINQQRGASLECLFFGREQSYPNRALNRSCDDFILHYVTDGKGVFNGRTVTAGEGFLVVPGIPHSMASDKDDPWHFKWISFSGSEARWQMKSIGLDEAHQFFTFRFADKLEELFDDILYHEHGDCDLSVYIRGIFYMILSYHKKQYLNDQLRKDSGTGYAREAMQYIDAHYREPIRIDDIAASLHISRKYLCAVLESTVGMSTKEYLLQKRLAVASELLLHTELTVSEIATEVGYGDYTQLSRLFRKKKGISPQQYRKREWKGRQI